MQLCLSDMGQTADDDLETLELLITPSAPVPATTEASHERSDEQRTESSIIAFYAAVSACADLHPDPDEDEDQGEGMDMDTAPGAGGWITSENMHEFVDENGEFRMPEGGMGGQALGAGAGVVRTADDAQFEDMEDGGEGEEGKWRRTG